MRDNISSDQELPETSYELSYYNRDNVIISSGPKNGFLWRGEVANPDDLIDSLKKVFQVSFTQLNEQSALASLPYIQSHSGFICASNTYYIYEDTGEKEFTGLGHEQASAGMYGYIYLIDTSEKNIQSIPLCEENLDNQAFVAGYRGEQLSEGPDYAIISKIDPKHIIGAMPSEVVAGILRVEEKSFIQNDNYQGSVSCAKLKEILDNPKLYRLELDKLVLAQASSSSTFFPRQPQSLESPSDSSEYNSYQCER